MRQFNIAVLGAGSWGTALSILLAKKGHHIKLWTHRDETMVQIREARENIRYLPGVIIPSNVEVMLCKEKAVKDVEVIIIAVPSHAVRTVAREISPWVKKGQAIVNVSKGLENETFFRLSQVLEQEIPQGKVAVLSGPSHAEEVSRDIPTAVIAAAKSRELAEMVQDVFITPKFRVYTNPDIIGVEMGGALKNIIALGAGISDGLGFGDNTKAALMTRGIVEIARLGEKMGASSITFAGLSGIGDLIVTCTSMHSRNRRAGMEIGKGKKLDTVLKEIGMVVEGVKTCEAAYHLSCKEGIEMPITSQIFQVLYQGKNPKEAVAELMLRDRTHESEEIIDRMNIHW